MKLNRFIVIAFVLYSFSARSQSADKLLKQVKSNASDKILESTTTAVNKAIDGVLSGKLFNKKKSKLQTQPASTDSIPVQASAPGIKGGGDIRLLSFTITDIDYEKLAAVTEILKMNPQVKSVKIESFAGATGRLLLNLEGSCFDFFSNLQKASALKYEVVELTSDKISVKALK